MTHFFGTGECHNKSLNVKIGKKSLSLIRMNVTAAPCTGLPNQIQGQKVTKFV